MSTIHNFFSELIVRPSFPLSLLPCVALHLRPDPRFVDRVPFLSFKRLWLEIYPSAILLSHEWRTQQLSGSKPEFILRFYWYKRTKASWGVSEEVVSEHPDFCEARVGPFILPFLGMVSFIISLFGHLRIPSPNKKLIFLLSLSPKQRLLYLEVVSSYWQPSVKSKCSVSNCHIAISSPAPLRQKY